MDGIINSCPGVLDATPAQMFLALINTLMAAQCSLKPPIMKDHGPNLQTGEEYDFIIVGAGSAGSVVANRLSEVEDWNVLVLEAGDDPSVTTQIPGLLFSIQQTSEDWQQKTQPQEYSCHSFKNKQCRWASGKVLGGSSSINGMIYVRGNSRDYDNWEKLGNTGWGWKNVLEYFKKSEDNLQFGDSKKYHGKGGYLKVGKYSEDNPIKKIIGKAAKELGYPRLKDIHNGSFIGFGDSQGTVYEGMRYSTYKAFLYSVKDRSNLHVAKNALVRKVFIDSATKTATGVEVNIGGKLLTVKAKKEIILSAGALKTPQILMLSGIGPKEHLEEIKIPVIQNLPVGKNLQDHLVYFGLFFSLREKEAQWAIKDIPTNDIENIYNYFMYQNGSLSTIGITNYVGFVNTLDSRSTFPDIQYHFVHYTKENSYLLKLVLDVMGVDDEIKNNILQKNKETALYQVWPKLLNPKSVGYLKLKSTDPQDSPFIYSNYLKEDADMQTMLRAINFVQKLLTKSSFSKHKPEIIDPKIPNCVDFKFLSDDYFKCALRNLASTVYHYSGTAKMGPDTDPTAVTDPRLRVRGIKKLRAADASIMPNVVSGNTNAACIMIGEKVSDMIKEDWHILNSKKDEL